MAVGQHLYVGPCRPPDRSTDADTSDATFIVSPRSDTFPQDSAHADGLGMELRLRVLRGRMVSHIHTHTHTHPTRHSHTNTTYTHQHRRASPLHLLSLLRNGFGSSCSNALDAWDVATSQVPLTKSLYYMCTHTNSHSRTQYMHTHTQTHSRTHTRSHAHTYILSRNSVGRVCMLIILHIRCSPPHFRRSSGPPL